AHLGDEALADTHFAALPAPATAAFVWRHCSRSGRRPLAPRLIVPSAFKETNSGVAQPRRMRHARRSQPTQNQRGEKGAMKINGFAAFVGVSALALLLQSAPASAQADCKALVPPSPFGPDDQTGATNRVTSAVTKAAAAESQTGNGVSMSNVLVDGVPLYGTRFSKTVLTSFAITPGAEFGKNKLSYMEDTWLSQSHVGTHIDGVGHIGIQDCYYNQTPI